MSTPNKCLTGDAVTDVGSEIIKGIFSIFINGPLLCKALNMKIQQMNIWLDNIKLTHVIYILCSFNAKCL